MAHEDGTVTVTFRSWKSFLDFTYSEMLDHDSYIWRGQRNESWSLETTLGRLVRESSLNKTHEFDKFKNNHLESFKYSARGRRGINPPELKDEKDWWALGQHYGLATPLLDWTESPFVAAYFAFIEESLDQDECRAIYALYNPSIEEIASRKKRKVDIDKMRRRVAHERGEVDLNPLEKYYLDLEVFPEVEFIRPFSNENQRLVSQRGLFTMLSENKTIDDWVKDNFQGNDESILIKFLIPNKERSECLKTLNRMNINDLTLFPDLEGASRYTNLHAKISNY